MGGGSRDVTVMVLLVQNVLYPIGWLQLSRNNHIQLVGWMVSNVVAMLVGLPMMVAMYILQNNARWFDVLGRKVYWCGIFGIAHSLRRA